jgi:hypothetical protein
METVLLEQRLLPSFAPIDGDGFCHSKYELNNQSRQAGTISASTVIAADRALEFGAHAHHQVPSRQRRNILANRSRRSDIFIEQVFCKKKPIYIVAANILRAGELGVELVIGGRSGTFKRGQAVLLQCMD